MLYPLHSLHTHIILVHVWEYYSEINSHTNSFDWLYSFTQKRYLQINQFYNVEIFSNKLVANSCKKVPKEMVYLKYQPMSDCHSSTFHWTLQMLAELITRLRNTHLHRHQHNRLLSDKILSHIINIFLWSVLMLSECFSSWILNLIPSLFIRLPIQNSICI